MVKLKDHEESKGFKESRESKRLGSRELRGSNTPKRKSIKKPKRSSENEDIELITIDLRSLGLPYFFFAKLECESIIEAGFSSGEIEEMMRSSTSRKLKKDLSAYFSGKMIDFDYDVKLLVPKFTARVLSEVSKIPYGKTETYKGLAERLGTKAYRATGRALARNPIPVIIPCHRVVGVKDLGGYMGNKEDGVKIKRFLLKLESHR